MNTIEISILAGLIFVAAMLYSSVGHAGASGYLAAMALFGLAPDVMKPTALVLNILVASITTVRFYRAGCFSWSRLWPFAIGSIPASFIGGALSLPTEIYKPLVGVVLWIGAARLAWPGKIEPAEPKPVPLGPGVLWGVSIGLLSGLTGTGGGIFLSPLLLFAGWAATRQTGGVSAAFILLNSLAGLAGRLTTMGQLPAALPVWALAATAGGLLGASLGSRRLAPARFRQLLALVLVIAGAKLLFA